MYKIYSDPDQVNIVGTADSIEIAHGGVLLATADGKLRTAWAPGTWDGVFWDGNDETPVKSSEAPRVIIYDEVGGRRS